MTTINSWEVLTNDGWQCNFYGTTAHRFTYRTNDQQRKREESADNGLHSDAITIMSLSISGVENIFTGPFRGFARGVVCFFSPVNEKFKGEGEGCCGLHVHLYITFTVGHFQTFYSFFFSSVWRFTSSLHREGEATYPGQIKAFVCFHLNGSLCSKENKTIRITFLNKQTAKFLQTYIILQNTAHWSPCIRCRSARRWSAGVVPSSPLLSGDPSTL